MAMVFGAIAAAIGFDPGPGADIRGGGAPARMRSRAERKPVDGGANGARFPYVSCAPADAKSSLCTGRRPRGSPRNPGLWRAVQRFCKSLLTVRRERTYIQPSTAGLLRAAAAGRLSELLRPLATRSTDRGSQFDRQRV